MGLLGLSKLIEMGAGGSVVNKRAAVKSYPYSKFNNLTIAVDVSLLMYETVLAVRQGGKDMTNKSGQLTSHLIGIFNKTLNFLQNGNIPIIVFDGKAPEIKSATVKKRREDKKKAAERLAEIEDSDDEEFAKNYKRSFNPTKEDFDELKIMFNLMGVPYIEAPGEADVVCAWLASRSDETGKRYVKGVCSDDGDILVHGARYLFRFMSKALSNPSKTVTVISQEKLLANLNLTVDQMYLLAALLGGDYNESISNIGPKKAYALVLKYKTLDGVFNAIRTESAYAKSKPFATDEIKARMQITIDYYASSVKNLDTDDNFVITDNNYKMRQYQYDNLFDFFCVKHNFDSGRVRKSLLRMKEYYDKLNINRPNTETYHIVSNPAVIKSLDVDYDNPANLVFLSESDSDSDSDSDAETIAQPAQKKNNLLVKKNQPTLKDLVKKARSKK